MKCAFILQKREKDQALRLETRQQGSRPPYQRANETLITPDRALRLETRRL